MLPTYLLSVSWLPLLEGYGEDVNGRGPRDDGCVNVKRWHDEHDTKR